MPCAPVARLNNCANGKVFLARVVSTCSDGAAQGIVEGLVKAVHGSRFLIGNNRGKTNGWVSANCIYGKCIQIE